MKSAKTLLGLFLLGGLAWAGDNGSRLDDIIKGMLGAMDKITGTLAGVKDEDTAKSAHPELKKEADEWLALRKRAENVAPPTRQESERLKKEYTAKLEEAQKKLFGEIARVQGVPGGKEVLQELGKALGRK